MDRKKNFFDMLGSLIPGYNGYAEREGRRNCDKVLRESIHSELAGIEKIIYDRILAAFSEKNKEHARLLEDNRKQLNTLSSKIKYAPHGSSSFFSDNQIKEDELLQIYQIDLELVESIKELGENVDTVTPIELKKLVARSYGVFGKRDNIVNQLK